MATKRSGQLSEVSERSLARQKVPTSQLLPHELDKNENYNRKR